MSELRLAPGSEKSGFKCFRGVIFWHTLDIYRNPGPQTEVFDDHYRAGCLLQAELWGEERRRVSCAASTPAEGEAVEQWELWRAQAQNFRGIKSITQP